MILWCIIVGGCAALFVGLGIYACRLKKPMGFWTGVAVKAEDITDIPAYNKANGRMWMFYSLWYWVSCLVYALSPLAAVVIMMAGGTVGTIGLMFIYRRIEAKYKK